MLHRYPTGEIKLGARFVLKLAPQKRMLDVLAKPKSKFPANGLLCALTHVQNLRPRSLGCAATESCQVYTVVHGYAMVYPLAFSFILFFLIRTSALFTSRC